MRFYRLEKKNYFKIFGSAGIKAIGLALMITMAIMIIAGYKFMIVSSGSMEPVLPVGSMIIVTPCEYDDLELGDIVTMDMSGIPLTHRVVGKMDFDGNIVEPDDPSYETSVWYTKGDNSDTLDGKLGDNIIGKVYESHCFTFTGTLVRYIKSNYVMLVILAIIMVVFVEVLHYLKGKLVEDDVECYEDEEE